MIKSLWTDSRLIYSSPPPICQEISRDVRRCLHMWEYVLIYQESKDITGVLFKSMFQIMLSDPDLNSKSMFCENLQ